MDARNDEQTELLRNIWNQIKSLDHNLSRKIDATNVELAGVKQEVAGVKIEVKALRGDVDGLKVEVKALRGDVDDLKVEVKGLRGDVDGLKGEVTELRGDVDGLTGEARGLRVATQDGFALLARADARRDRDMDELRSRIERVEQHVGLGRP